jgi:hypothetical protein
MKRRDLLRAAAVSPLLAGAVKAQEARERPEALPADAAHPWPSEEKLTKARRELVEAMAKVLLDNGDPPDLLPRPRRRR